jgi:uncharacterized phage-associated protein
MNTNAISVANYFIDLAKESGIEIRQFGLMKRVYITHGFCLAILAKSALDSRFDTVEAWKNGPVIPSVYHSFKHNGTNSITTKSIIPEVDDKGNITIIVPQLEDIRIQDIAKGVWKRYIDFTDIELINLLHKPGTPWDLCYAPGRNNPIPDLYTKLYYKKLIDYERNQKRNRT